MIGFFSSLFCRFGAISLHLVWEFPRCIWEAAVLYIHRVSNPASLQWDFLVPYSVIRGEIWRDFSSPCVRVSAPDLPSQIHDRLPCYGILVHCSAVRGILGAACFTSESIHRVWHPQYRIGHDWFLVMEFWFPILPLEGYLPAHSLPIMRVYLHVVKQPWPKKWREFEYPLAESEGYRH
jgi:hypothetical protein